jgi:hypothetical protein
VNASLREGGGLVINLSFPSASQTGSLRILT